MVQGGITELPEELLTQVLRYLSGSSLKNARLTCKRWSAAGARNLYRRIYFTPLPEAMQMFSNITENPDFTFGVEELVYDARIFWRHLVDKRIYRCAYEYYHNPHLYVVDLYELLKRRKLAGQPAERLEHGQHTHDEEYEARLSRSRDWYNKIHHTQHSLFLRGRDFEVLSAGMQRLPNMKKIAISEDFAPVQASMAPTCIDHTWPDRQMEKLAGESVLPRSFKNSFYWFDKYEYKGESRCIAQNCLQYVNLLRAIALICPKIEELCLGHPDCPIDLEIFSVDIAFQSAQEVMPRLKVLESHCNTSFSKKHPLRKELAWMIYAARGLKKLSLSSSMGRSLFSRPPPQAQWPDLKIFELDDTEVKALRLGYLFFKQRSTLRELTLRRIRLLEGTWEHIAKLTGGLVCLDRVCLEMLMVSREEVPIAEDELELILRLFMDEVPDEKLHIQMVEPHRGPLAIGCRQGYETPVDD